MAQQDIVVRMGMDSTEFHRKLGEAKAGAGGLAGALGAIGGMLSLGAAVAWLTRVSEKMVDLRRQSEDLGASISFVAGISKLERQFDAAAGSGKKAMTVLAESIGKARTEGGEAAKDFKKFGIELFNLDGSAKSNEAIFKEISTAYANAGDAASRAAVSYAFFGKAGREINNILGMGGKGLDEYIAKQKELGAIMGERGMRDASKNWEQIRNMVFGATDALGQFANKAALGLRAAGAFFRGVAQGDIRGSMTRMRESLATGGPDEGMNRNSFLETEESILDRLTTQRAELDKINRLIEEQGASDEKLLDLLMGDMEKSMERIRGMEEGSLDRAKEELEMKKKEVEYTKIRQKMEESDKQALRERDQAVAKIAASQKEYEASLARAAGQRGQAVQAATDARAERTKFTNEQLVNANINNVKDPRLRADIIEARKAQALENRANFLKFRGGAGDLGEAGKLFSQAEKVRAGISSLSEAERFPFKSIDAGIASVDEAIRELNKKAEGDGLKVKAVLSK